MSSSGRLLRPKPVLAPPRARPDVTGNGDSHVESLGAVLSPTQRELVAEGSGRGHGDVILLAALAPAPLLAPPRARPHVTGNDDSHVETRVAVLSTTPRQLVAERRRRGHGDVIFRAGLAPKPLLASARLLVQALLCRQENGDLALQQLLPHGSTCIHGLLPAGQVLEGLRGHV
jgi:hypothetical protein